LKKFKTVPEIYDYVKKYLKPLRVVSYKADKYGRWLADIFVGVDGVEKNANQLLIEAGHAVPYMT
jgi:endonuclease YncB( thermonuclease family)